MEFMDLALTLVEIIRPPRLRGFLSVPAVVHDVDGGDGGTLHRTVGSLATAIPCPDGGPRTFCAHCAPITPELN